MYADSTAQRVLTLSVACLSLLAATAVAADPANDAPIAKIGTQTLSYQQLLPSIQGKLDEQQQQHHIQLQQINLSFERTREAYIEAQAGKLLDERVLALEAAARKTTAQALLAALKIPPVTPEQIQAFYDGQKGQLTQPFEQVAPKIRQFLENQATERSRRQYFDALRIKYQAVLTLEPAREQVAATGPVRGPANAPVTIVEFSDFQCPFCGRYTPTLKRIQAAYPTQVRLVYRYFPLAGIHPQAQKAAEAAACANLQDKFWQMHDTLFAEQDSLDLEALKDKASRLGLDKASFESCLDGGQAAPIVATDVADGQELGLDGTPGSFVNGRFVNGAVSYEELSALIDDELRRGASKPSH